MGGIKVWQWAVFGAAVVALAWFACSALGGRNGVRFARGVTMIDVTTGELFSFEVGGRRAVVVPERNPRTGKAALLGVEKVDDGRWFIRERHLPNLANVEGEPVAVVDRQTGEVRPESERVRRGRS